MSLVLSEDGRDTIKCVIANKGWTLSGALPNITGLSSATIGRILSLTPVKKENMIAFCGGLGRDWRELIDPDRSSKGDFLPIKYWNRAPYVPTLYGREQNLRELKRKVSEGYRVIAIYGIEGIGKSVLVVKLAEQVQLSFDYLIYYPLGQGEALRKVLTSICKFLNISSLPSNQSTSDLLSLIMQFFCKNRCLLVLENFEAILRSGHYAGSYQEECKNFQDFIRRMGEEQHISCLIVTSRELPGDISELQKKDLRVWTVKLQGLLEDAARELLKAKGLPEERQWRELNRAYGGNPFCLKVMSEYIKEWHNGSVQVFLKRKQTFLVRDIKGLIAKIIDRLTNREKDILYKLAKQEEPVPYSQIKTVLSLSFPRLLEMPIAELHDAIDSLMKRSLIEKKTLIEKNEVGLGLPQIVSDYIKELNPEED